VRAWFANGLRVGASPAVAYALNKAYYETDLVDVLPAVRVPTLVLYRGVENEEDALDVARRIPTAHAVRLPGELASLRCTAVTSDAAVADEERPLARRHGHS